MKAPLPIRYVLEPDLVSTPLMFGIVRQWAALSGDGPLENRPFFDEAEALRWLRE